MMSEPVISSPVHPQNISQGSPAAGGPLIGDSTPASRVKCSFRRTPLGIRRNFNKGFKSPVQSPHCSHSPKETKQSLEIEISDLKRKDNALDAEIAQLEAEGYSVEELEQHITLLHQYNELKDTGQMLLGRLAVLRDVTTKDLYAEFGMDLED